MSTVATTHIEIDEHGVAWIAGANTKVIEVVLDKLAYGWSPEEIHFQHPHLALSQIHAALAYYYDHQEEIDGDIERRRQEVDALAAEAADSPLQQKLGELKRQSKER
jgi:uncharacterized protein (DUF433 family)